ncbi:MAG: MFS transporter [Candidatus Limnocylindria bacterium]
MTQSAHPERPLLPLHQLLTLSVYWFGIVAIWGGLNSVILPQRLDEIDPARLGMLTAITVFAGAVAPILVQPTIGNISDYTVSRWGRRKPYIVIGTLLDMAFLFGLASSNEFVSIVAFYFLLQFSSNFAQGPFQGYVPDLVPAGQVGMASGLMGTMIVLGTVGGIGIATTWAGGGEFFLPTIALGAVELLTMIILVFTVDEGRTAPARTRSWREIALSAWGRDILQQANLLWVLAVRLFFLAGYAATTFGIAYFMRSLGQTRAEANETFFIGTAIIGAATALAAIPGGRLSDRFGRRPVIWAASGLAAGGLLGVAAAPSPALAISSFVLFGLGMGTFLSVDWALMTDVIPKHTSGRYMGILNAGTAMAQPVFLLVGGVALDLTGIFSGNPTDPLGPRVAMIVAALFVVAAGLALLKVDPRRREEGAAAVEPQPVPA